MEQELFSSDKSMDEKVPELRKRYGTFFDLFCMNVIKVGSRDEQIVGSLKDFVYDSDIKKVYEKVQQSYPSLEVEFKEIEDGFKRYHVLFPNKVVPHVCSFISGFNYAIVVTDSMLGIGLDMYLGPDFAYYDMLRFPQYRKNRLDRTYLVKDAFKGWLQSEFEKNKEDKSFLNEIVHQGKLLYILHQLLPNYNSAQIFGYRSEQWNWCRKNEAPMWTFFVSEKLFYSTSFTEYHKYINEGPFTTGFDRESPDQTGYYIGWRIVDSYMKNNPNTSVAELINIQDPKIILSKSGYKPL